MKKKKYLVTGGTGFIGSALVHRLVENGYHVRIFDNNSRGMISRLNDLSRSIEIINADIRDSSALRRACKGIDRVIHLAFLNGTEFFYTLPELVLDIGVKGIVNVIDACIKERVKEFFLSSSSEVYQTPTKIPTDEKVALSIPDPLNPRYSYAAGKIISEIMAINYGRKYFKRMVVFRPHNVYGPDMGHEHVIPQFALRMKSLCQNKETKTIKFPIQGTGKQTRAFVFIEDFIEGVMILLKRGKHLNIYNIGTNDEISIGQLAKEMGIFFAKKLIVIPKEPARGATERRCPDISKIRELGYNPKIKLKEGLKITLDWYIKNN